MSGAGGLLYGLRKAGRFVRRTILTPMLYCNYSLKRMSRFIPCLLFCLLPLISRGGSQDLYLQSLTNFETYGESIWHSANYSGAPPDAGYWGDGATTGNGGIRGNAGVALAYAVMVVAEPTSSNNPTRLNHIRQALNYNANTHTTGGYVAEDGDKWGWNSGTPAPARIPGPIGKPPCEAAPTAFACFLQQTNLPSATIQAVQTMLISEANHRATVAPCSGWVGDTKAEENGWDGNDRRRRRCMAL